MEDVEEAKAKNIDFDVFQITEIASNLMNYWFQNRQFSVLDTTIVGCWKFYFDKGYHVPNFADVMQNNNFENFHVHACQRICCNCGSEYLKVHSLRKTGNVIFKLPLNIFKKNDTFLETFQHV